MKKTLLLLALMLSAAAAQALPISGEIHFGGMFSTDTGDLASATKIVDFPKAFVIDATGDFKADGIEFSDPATIVGYSFDPDLIVTNPLWTVKGTSHTWTFDLSNISVSLQTSSQLNMIGDGMIYRDGVDATSGAWVFTGNSGGSIFTFSAHSNSVPEPAILALMGLGFVGMGAVRRRARQN